ncbi:MAG: RagB/SusD family nutrient uptake outer membrane protein [Paludibacteraceae bacterium]
MKRFKINKYAAFLLVILLPILSGCEGDLEPDVYDKLTGDNFPKTEKDAESLVSSVYYQLRGGEWSRYNSANQSRLVVGLMGTDEFTCQWPGYWGSPFYFTWKPDEFPFSDLYYAFVPAVTTATSAIAQLRKMGDVLNPTLLERYIAELKVARAYFMYDLYNLYGPVSVITNENDAMNIKDYSYQPRPTGEQMVQLIEADLSDDVIEKLEVKYTDSEFGRFTQGAAMMCLLKLYLHEKDWINVEKYAKKIRDLKTYDLQLDYKSIWSIDNERNSEIIFALACQPTPEGVANNFRAHVLPPDWKSPNGYTSLGWNGYKVPWQFYDTFDDADKRRECLERYYTNILDEVVDTRAQSQFYGAMPLKYSEDPAGTGVNQGVDYVVYRYADVLLALAESLNEQNGPTQPSIDLINEVRKRAFEPDKPIALADFTDKQALREHILKERGWELYFEGNRREDLIRHDKFIEYANDPARMGSVRPKNPQQNAKSYHVLYPIPNKAIVESKGVLKQNTGYE